MLGAYGRRTDNDRLYPACPVLNKSEFHYELPTELIAQAPLPTRSASRLLVLPPDGEPWRDAMVRDLPQYLEAGDLVVFNDTRVIPARLHGHKDSGGRVEILVERLLGKQEFLAQLRSSKSPKPETRIVLDDGTQVTVVGREDGFFHLRVDTDEPLESLLQRLGKVPLPPYMTREPDAADAERYQTVFAHTPGAVAAPTAGLHIDADFLAALAARGVQTGYVTLHVGAGTFQPMRVERIEDHVMHSEWLNVDAQLCEAIRATRARGGRVLAVGTTVVRALETAWRDGEVRPYAGETRLFLFPGRAIHSVDMLLTNFHLPESTLLMLVSAFAGQTRVMAAYEHAVRERYRFFSYGDAMLVYPEGESACRA